MAGTRDQSPARDEPSGDDHPAVLVGVTDLRRHLGESRDISRTVHLPTLRVSDTVVEEGTDIDVALTLESITGAISATGTIRTRWTSSCRRCLDPVDGTLDQEVDELFASDHVEGESYPLGRETIDLEPLIRETVLLSLPQAPLCRPDCPGPHPTRSPSRRRGRRRGAGERPVDPRWAALDVLRDEFEE